MLLSPLQAQSVLQHALENRYAILAINADSHAAVTDCLEAALQAQAPVIIETSLWQIKGHSFGAGDAVLGVARYLANLAVLANSSRYKNIPVIYHTDHIKGPETFTILEAAIKGIPFSIHEHQVLLTASTVSLDASEFTHEQTIEYISHLCDFAQAHYVPVTLEMEDAVDEGITPASVAEHLLGSVEKKHPGKVFLWAPGVGTQHGFGENMNFSPKTIEEQVALTKKITGREIGIALHGSTGLSDAHLSAAAGAGVIKVNWSTESLYLRNVAAQQFFTDKKDCFDKKHKDWKNTVMDNGLNAFISQSYVPKVVHRMQVLGGHGQAKGAMAAVEKQSATVPVL